MARKVASWGGISRFVSDNPALRRVGEVLAGPVDTLFDGSLFRYDDNGRLIYKDVEANKFFGGPTSGADDSPTFRTLTIGDMFADQSANEVFAGPTSGADAEPAFRSLVLDDLPKGIIAAGIIAMYGGSSVPAGWLECDGQAVSRTTYADLFSAIGTTFGNGDGSTTFTLPNFKGRSPLGAGQGNTAEGGGTGTNRSLAAAGGAETHTLTDAQMPTHRHSVDIAGNTLTGAGSNRMVEGGAAGTQFTNNAGSGQSHNNMHPFLVVKFIIKT